MGLFLAITVYLYEPQLILIRHLENRNLEKYFPCFFVSILKYLVCTSWEEVKNAPIGFPFPIRLDGIIIYHSIKIHIVHHVLEAK